MKILAVLLALAFLCSCTHFAIVKLDSCKKVSDNLSKCEVIDED